MSSDPTVLNCLGEELYKYSCFRSDPLIYRLQMHMFVVMHLKGRSTFKF